MLIPQIRAATQLWLDVGTDANLSDDLARLNAGNMARDDMLAGIISVDDWLDVLADLGLDVDLFCSQIESELGGINAQNSGSEQ